MAILAPNLLSGGGISISYESYIICCVIAVCCCSSGSNDNSSKTCLKVNLAASRIAKSSR